MKNIAFGINMNYGDALLILRICDLSKNYKTLEPILLSKLDSKFTKDYYKACCLLEDYDYDEFSEDPLFGTFNLFKDYRIEFNSQLDDLLLFLIDNKQIDLWFINSCVDVSQIQLKKLIDFDSDQFSRILINNLNLTTNLKNSLSEIDVFSLSDLLNLKLGQIQDKERILNIIDYLNTKHLEYENLFIPLLDINITKTNENYFYSSLGFDIQQIPNTYLDSYSFSNKVLSLFSRFKLYKVHDFLNCRISDLLNSKGIGEKAINEIKEFIASLINKYKDHVIEKEVDFFVDYKEQIKNGDFSFIENFTSPINKNKANYIKASYSMIDKEFIDDCLEDKVNRKTIFAQIEAFSFETELEFQLQNILKKIPDSNKNKAISVCLDFYQADDDVRKNILSMYSSESSSLSEINRNKIKSLESFNLVKDFLSSFCFDFVSDLNSFFTFKYLDDKKFFIADNRGKGKTLEEIGCALSLSRERIRQVQDLLFSKLYQRFLDERIYDKLIFHFGHIFPATRVLKINFKYNYALYWFLTNLKDEDLHYTQDLQSIVYKDSDKKIWDFIDSLASILNEKDFNNYMKQASTSLNVSYEIIKTAFNVKYIYSRGVYSKTSNAMKMIIHSIINDHFPNGIKVYDDKDLAKFREYAKAEFSSFDLPVNKRALSARIIDYCQLVGQGTYNLKQEFTLSPELRDRIKNYILTNGQPLLFIKAVFDVFQDDLFKVGILNKHAFQSVLREYFEDDFIFTKDYVSSEEQTLSIRKKIIETIKQHVSPINKEELVETFPYMSYYILMFSENDKNILSYRSSFFHVDNIQTTEEEKNQILDEISKYLNQNKIAYAKLLYPILLKKFPDFLLRNYANDYFSFYSLIEYVFQEDFYFKRPLIATLDSENKTLGQWLKSYYKKDIISLEELSYFKNNVALFNEIGLLIFANSCNDTFFINDNKELVSIEYSGITIDTVKQLDNLLSADENERIISTLITKDIALPKINISWNDMLLYSAIFKWSTKFFVSSTNNDFKSAQPLIRLAKHKLVGKIRVKENE